MGILLKIFLGFPMPVVIDGKVWEIIRILKNARRKDP